MKFMKTLGLLVGVISLCGAFAYTGTLLSHWDDPVKADQRVAAKPDVQKAPSNVQAAALAAAQESTDLTQ